MTVSQPELWTQIEHIQPDRQGSTLSFVQRLARDNHWPEDFAQRCLQEYKRFIYLAAISDKPVTPSDEVDQVWHLHLTYTHAYWIDLCDNILSKKIHHTPTEGGEKETNKFKRQYSATLALYQREFGESPPEDIWPTVEDRFNAQKRYARLDLSKYWLLRKSYPRWAAVGVASALVSACSPKEGESQVFFWLKVALGVYVVYKVAKWMSGGRGGGSGSGGCGSACGSGCGGD